jgi:hypothetical protein
MRVGCCGHCAVLLTDTVRSLDLHRRCGAYVVQIVLGLTVMHFKRGARYWEWSPPTVRAGAQQTRAQPAGPTRATQETPDEISPSPPARRSDQP